MEQIFTILHETLKRSKLSAEQISERAFGRNGSTGKLNKSLSAIYKELDPDITTAKLGLVDFIRIVEVTGDVEALAAIVRRVGYIMRKIDGITPDQPHWQGEHAQDTAHLGKMSEMMTSGVDPSVLQTYVVKACADLEETAIRYARDYDAGKIKPKQQVRQ